MRTDLGMDLGKTASQTGHAFVGAAITSQTQNPSALAAYHKDLPHSPGTKIVLAAPSQSDILKAQRACNDTGIPSFLVIDSGCSNFFNGQPIITALGVGPVRKAQVKNILGRFQLL